MGYRRVVERGTEEIGGIGREGERKGRKIVEAVDGRLGLGRRVEGRCRRVGEGEGRREMRGGLALFERRLVGRSLMGWEAVVVVGCSALVQLWRQGEQRTRERETNEVHSCGLDLVEDQVEVEAGEELPVVHYIVSSSVK